MLKSKDLFYLYNPFTQYIEQFCFIRVQYVQGNRYIYGKSLKSLDMCWLDAHKTIKIASEIVLYSNGKYDLIPKDYFMKELLDFDLNPI